MGLVKAEQLHTRRGKNSAFLCAEMGSGQAEQQISWPPIYTLFFVCLALVVVQGSANSRLCAHVYIVLKGRRLKLQVQYYLSIPGLTFPEAIYTYQNVLVVFIFFWLS
jgi:hypothetical protein